MGDIPTLNDLANDYRRKKGKAQDVAKALGLSPSELSNILGGRRGDDAQIVRIAEHLEAPVGRFLLAAAVARCGQAKKTTNDKRRRNSVATGLDPARLWEKAHAEYQRILAGLLAQREEVSGARHPKMPLSLEDFPNLLDGKWTLIAGDRRERRPKGLGDLVALDVSATDFMFMAGLRLPPESRVLSDKIMVIGSEKNRRNQLSGSNLLLIGSPAVSLATRRVLGSLGATFTFNIASATYERELKLYIDLLNDAIPGAGDRLKTTRESEKKGLDIWDEELVEMLADSCNPDQLEAFRKRDGVASEIRAILANYMKSGFVDPVAFRGIRGVSRSRTIDYGMVAISENPWSPSHIVVICAGVGGGGTAGAVKLLATPGRFSKHPWGGIFTVNLNDQVPWERRFNNIMPDWDTKEYDPDEYMEEAGSSCASLKEHADIGERSVERIPIRPAPNRGRRKRPLIDSSAKTCSSGLELTLTNGDTAKSPGASTDPAPCRAGD